MKKWILLIACLLIVCLTCVYVFIPSEIKITTFVDAKTTRDGAFRVISSKQTWPKWLKTNTSNLDRNDLTFTPTGAGNYNTQIIIADKKNSVQSNINVLQLNDDSIIVNWQCALEKSTNPFEKIQQYFFAVNLKKNMDSALASLKIFIQNDKNIYGIDIRRERVKDSFMITTKQLFTQQPNMKDVYKLVDVLKNYAAKNNCIETNVPMLNILHDSDRYRIMVALPVNKQVPTLSTISSIKMVDGNFMVTQVQGGLATVQNALDQLQFYVADYNKTSMAITFQYLVTNRLQEADTTKWITKIYAPVLQ